MDLLDLSLFVVLPADLLLVLVAFTRRRHHDRRWFDEALCQGLVIGACGAFVLSVGVGMVTGSNAAPAFLLLLLVPISFGVAFALGLAGVHAYRFLP